MLFDKQEVYNQDDVGGDEKSVIAKKGNELHEPRYWETYDCIDLIKNEKIEAFVFQIKNAVGYQRKSYQGANKKYENDH